MTDVSSLVVDLVRRHDPETTSAKEFLEARFDAGLAWVRFPVGDGGLGREQSLQQVVDDRLKDLGAPAPVVGENAIGHGMAAPTIAAFGSPAQRKRFLRPLWTNDEKWCQLFSEPGAGSDLAAVSTRAVRDGDGWVVNGQKVWTSGAHVADWAILLARTDVDVPKHQGMTYFLCDMSDPGVEVRPLRQITGEAEFNEVFLTDVRIPDSCRLGDVGGGWKVANATLNNERVAISAGSEREAGLVGLIAERWRMDPAYRSPDLRDELMKLWVDVEATRLAGEQLRQRAATRAPGPEAAAMKLAFATQARALSGLALQLEGEEGLRHDTWEMVRPTGADFNARGPGYRYLRAKGNSIEGGTSEVLRNILAERVLGLPSEPRVDKGIPFKEIPR